MFKKKKEVKPMTAKELMVNYPMYRYPAHHPLYLIEVGKDDLSDDDARKMANTKIKVSKDELVVMHAKKFKRMVKNRGFVFEVVPKSDKNYNAVFVCRDIYKNELRSVIQSTDLPSKKK